MFGYIDPEKKQNHDKSHEKSQFLAHFIKLPWRPMKNHHLTVKTIQHRYFPVIHIAIEHGHV